MTNEEMAVLINTIEKIARKECEKILNERNVETIMYGKILAIDGENYTVQVAGAKEPYTNLKNKSSSSLEVGNSVVIKAIKGNAGNGYIAIKMG